LRKRVAAALTEVGPASIALVGFLAAGALEETSTATNRKLVNIVSTRGLLVERYFFIETRNMIASNGADAVTR
jgi:hypothetical protein